MSVTEKNISIPKKIYYFWIGNKKMPDICNKCVASWKKYMPGYEIIKVTDDMVDLNCNNFVKKAIESKYFGYAVDYLRLKWLYENGGIYFDTDVELIESIDDIVEKGEFFAFQSNYVSAGLGFAVKKHNELLKELMKPYEIWDEKSFLGKNGFPNIAPCPVVNSPIFEKFGVKENNTYQEINGIHFYPEEYFSPLSFDTRELKIVDGVTKAIHHGTGLCNDPLDLWMNRYRQKISKKRKGKEIPYKIYQIRLYFFHPVKALRYHFKHNGK